MYSVEFIDNFIMISLGDVHVAQSTSYQYQGGIINCLIVN